MEIVSHLVDWVLHVDQHLKNLVETYGALTYAILFLIVFCETGLVVTPFLPGDSLLFVAGALAAGGRLNIAFLLLILMAAAIVGDSVNYQAGHFVGPRVFGRSGGGRTSRLLKREHLDRTEAFFARYGGKTILLARFVPIVRTVAPFVAGMGSMAYARFLAFNVVGGVLWVALLTLAGYWFGSIPAVEHNFTLVILAIIFISLLPPLFEYLRSRRQRTRTPAPRA
jgi:membrane-associated protein